MRADFFAYLRHLLNGKDVMTLARVMKYSGQKTLESYSVSLKTRR
jgi:hypothetical protein